MTSISVIISYLQRRSDEIGVALRVLAREQAELETEYLGAPRPELPACEPPRQLPAGDPQPSPPAKRKYTRRRGSSRTASRTARRSVDDSGRSAEGQSERTCARPDCGKSFAPPRADSRFCSKACRDRSYNRSRATGKPVGRPPKAAAPRGTRVAAQSLLEARPCDNPECGRAFQPKRRTQRVCPRPDCILWMKREYQRSWADKRRRAEGRTVGQGRRKAHNGYRQMSTAEAQAAALETGTPSQLRGLTPRDALIKYAELHGGRLMVAEAATEIRVAGIFGGTEPAVRNKLRDALDQLDCFEYHTADNCYHLRSAGGV